MVGKNRGMNSNWINKLWHTHRLKYSSIRKHILEYLNNVIKFYSSLRIKLWIIMYNNRIVESRLEWYLQGDITSYFLLTHL
jgi:hypothetical protein